MQCFRFDLLWEDVGLGGSCSHPAQSVVPAECLPEMDWPFLIWLGPYAVSSLPPLR